MRSKMKSLPRTPGHSPKRGRVIQHHRRGLTGCDQRKGNRNRTYMEKQDRIQQQNIHNSSNYALIGEQNKMFNGDVPSTLRVRSHVMMSRLGVSELAEIQEHKAGTSQQGTLPTLLTSGIRAQMQCCTNTATKASLLRASLDILAQQDIKRLFFCAKEAKHNSSCFIPLLQHCTLPCLVSQRCSELVGRPGQ